MENNKKEKVKEYSEKIKDTFNNLTPEQKTIGAGICGLCVGVVLGVLIYNKK